MFPSIGASGSGDGGPCSTSVSLGSEGESLILMYSGCLQISGSGFLKFLGALAMPVVPRKQV